MMSVQTANVGTTAVNVTWPERYETIVVTNQSSNWVYVTTDGSTATTSSLPVGPGNQQVFGNGLPLPDPNSANVLGNLTDTTDATQVSVIASAAGSPVTVAAV